MVSAAEPELESERLCVAVVPTLTLPKLNEAAPKARTGEPVPLAAVPVPVRATSTVGSVALLEMMSVPESAPAAVGANVAVNRWLLPGSMVSGKLIPEI
jgi:hypothetical protein